MSSFMPLQMCFLPEKKYVIILVFSLPKRDDNKNIDVPFWIKSIPKCLIAKTTTKGTNIFMHSHMNNQIIRFCKRLATNFTIFKNPITSFVISNCTGQILLGYWGHRSDRAGQAGTSSHIDLGFGSIIISGSHFGDLRKKKKIWNGALSKELVGYVVII